MTTDHSRFCQADPVFYDVPPADPTFEVARRLPPAGWRRTESENWVMYAPEPDDLPPQGWKIHVSGCEENAELILETVWDCCVRRRLPFKVLRSRRALLARNAKDAPRGHSGKLVAVYPRHDRELEAACVELDERLAGQPGPAVPSDLRWGDGPVYVRYGGFRPLYLRTASGQVVPAIRDDTGRPVPDQRAPVFTLWSWVPVPAFLRPHLAAARTAASELPYTMVETLRVSNGGAISVGEHRDTGRRVVVKAARPFAGLTSDGADAPTRLRREHAILRRLAGVAAVPGVVDLLEVDDHLFLVTELLGGIPLDRELVRRNPALGAGQAEADYARWAMAVCRRVEDALEAVHDRGVVLAGLHARDILVRADGGIALLEYEQARDLDGPRTPPTPAARAGTAVDGRASARLRLDLFAPLADLCEIAPGKAWELAEVIRERFPVPRSWLDEAARTVAGTEVPPEVPPFWAAVRAEGWVALRAVLVRAIEASATPLRHDRLFPGDPAQFATGGTTLSHGAAGVLYALSVTGANRRPDLEDWLAEHARRPVRKNQLGFYDGLHGVAYVLHHLGHRRLALELVERCLAAPWEDAGDDLRTGLAGMALNLAHFAQATGESGLLTAAVRAAEMIADRLGSIGGGRGGQPDAGLMRGWSGPALLFIRLYETTGETAWLDQAALALRRDLVLVDDGPRPRPGLATGSVGIGLVLDRYLTHRADEQFVTAGAAIETAAQSWFQRRAGLFSGRAGMVYHLARRTRAADPAAYAELDAQIALLRWHAFPHQGGVAFAGDGLSRLSMDLATGTAGVLLALGAAFHGGPVDLPFL